MGKLNGAKQAPKKPKKATTITVKKGTK